MSSAFVAFCDAYTLAKRNLPACVPEAGPGGTDQLEPECTIAEVRT